MCESLANLYLGSASQPEGWSLRFTGIPVVVLDLGETRSRSKRRIQILLAERGTCFTLWRETIDNLSSYKVNDSFYFLLPVSTNFFLELSNVASQANTEPRLEIQCSSLTFGLKCFLISSPLVKQKIDCQH